MNEVATKSQESVEKAQNLFNLNLKTEIQFNATDTALHGLVLLLVQFQKAILRLHKWILVHDCELPPLRIVRPTHMTTTMTFNCQLHCRHDCRSLTLNWPVSNPKWPGLNQNDLWLWLNQNLPIIAFQPSNATSTFMLSSENSSINIHWYYLRTYQVEHMTWQNDTCEHMHFKISQVNFMMAKVIVAASPPNPTQTGNDAPSPSSFP